MFLPAPRGLADPARVDERMRLLATDDRLRSLSALVEDVAKRRKGFVPHFDPADAGVEARVLIVLESPGPKTVPGDLGGSGFVSVDNDDQTAENLWHARAVAGLHQDRTAVWNIVPWFIGPGDSKPSASDRAAGSSDLRRLLPLLSALQVIVLGGRHAQMAWNDHIVHQLDDRQTVIAVPLPSDRGLSRPEARADLARGLERAASYL